MSRLPVASLTPTRKGGQRDIPGDAFYCCGYSQDAGYFVWSKYGGVNVVDEMPGATRSEGGPSPFEVSVAVPLQEPDQFAVSEDGTEVAVAGGGALYVAQVRGSGIQPTQELPGTGGITALAFLGGSQRLVSASGTALVLWNLSQVSRITAGPIINAPDSANVGTPPEIAVSPDGKHIATAGESLDPTVILQNLATSPPTETTISEPVTTPLPMWSADSTRLFLLGDDRSGNGAVQWSGGRFDGAWRVPSAQTEYTSGQVLAAGLSPDGKRVVLVDDSGDIQVRRAGNGAVLHATPGGQEVLGSGAPPQNVAAVSSDANVVAVVLPSGVVRVTNVQSGQSHDLPGVPATAVTFAEDRLLVQRQDNSLEVWDTAGTRLFRSTPGDAQYAHAIAAVPHSGLVARVTEQGNIELSALGSGQVLGSLHFLTPPAQSENRPGTRRQWRRARTARSRSPQRVARSSAGSSIPTPGSMPRALRPTVTSQLTSGDVQSARNRPRILHASVRLASTP